MKKLFILWVSLLLPLGLWAENAQKAPSPTPKETQSSAVTATTNGAPMMQGKMKKMMSSPMHQKMITENESLKRKVDELEKEVKKLKGKSEHLVLGNLKLWGYLRMRYLDDLRGKYSAFSLEEMTVNLAYHPANYITAWMNFWIHPNQIAFGLTGKEIFNGCDVQTAGNKCLAMYPSEMIGYVYIERAQAQLQLPKLGPITHAIRIGKWYRAAFGIPPKYPNRKISDYSLVSEAFTHDRVIGLDYLLSFKHTVNFAASLYNGLAIGARNFGPSDPVSPTGIPIIADREIVTPGKGNLAAVTDNDYNKEVSFKLGYQWPGGAVYGKEYATNGKYFQMDAFGTIGNKLTDADIGYLTRKLGVPATLVPNRKKFRAGADIRLVVGRFSYDAEIFKGWTSKIQSIGYHILGVYKVFPNKLHFLARYAELDYPGIGADVSGNVPALWNKRQVQLSLKVFLAKWAWIQTEYYFNFEGPKGDITWKHKGMPSTNNDVFFVEFVFFYM